MFLPAVVLLYYMLPANRRWILLLLASYLFYGWWKAEYLTLIVASTLVDYSLARFIYRQQNPLYRKTLLAASIAVNLGILFAFKYLVLFVKPPDLMQLNIYSAIHPLKGSFINAVFYVLPVGISFYTFQTMSYTLDVYYGRTQPENNLGKFALFVSYFPQLVAGPIERFSHLQPQLLAKHQPLYRNFSQAWRLLLWGFFVKICIADNLSPVVDAVFTEPQKYGQAAVWLGVLGFGLQIYADFSGYTLIAQGASLMLGIRLMDNFRTPYLATSIGEFWQRWHISLSTWFRDYVYIPLGGNKVKTPRWLLNIMIVFVLSGFWHGANWTFMIWGGIHGFLYLLEHLAEKGFGVSRIPGFIRKPAGLVITYAAVHFAWIFFRIKNLKDFGPLWQSLWQHSGSETLDTPVAFWPLLLLFLCLDILLYNKRIDHVLDNKPAILRWLLYALLLFCVLLFGGTANHPFIYFQF